jgi:hypothetical protein
VLAAFPYAPGPIEVYCQWSGGSDSNMGGCLALLMVSPTEALSPRLERWVRTANRDALRNGVGVLATIDGRDFILSSPLTVAQVDSDSSARLVTWECKDTEVSYRLSELGEDVPAAEIAAADCTYAVRSGSETDRRQRLLAP